jgi:uracil-DNA glycosylase
MREASGGGPKIHSRISLMTLSKMKSVVKLQAEITQCSECPRLVKWREKIAAEKVPRYQEWDYWGKPVPSLGGATATLLIVGLAPAAHGGNRTGRIFTGDRSGDWLYRSLHKFGFANQPISTDRNDGLVLTDCYITAIVHCAPPLNKPDPHEIRNCHAFLRQEWELLRQVKVIVALGRLAFDQIWKLINSSDKRPIFRHGLEVRLDERKTMLASFHPSQQNTFTGKLTEPMFDGIFHRARQLIERSAGA